MSISSVELGQFEESLVRVSPQTVTDLQYKICRLARDLAEIPSCHSALLHLSLFQAVLTPANRGEYEAICALFERVLAKLPSVPAAFLKPAYQMWQRIERNRKVEFPGKGTVTVACEKGSMLYELGIADPISAQQFGTASIPHVKEPHLPPVEIAGFDAELTLAVLDYCSRHQQRLAEPLHDMCSMPSEMKGWRDQAMAIQESDPKGHPILSKALERTLGVQEFFYGSLSEKDGFKLWKQTLLFLDFLSDNSLTRLPGINELIFDFNSVSPKLLLEIIKDLHGMVGSVPEAAYLAAHAEFLRIGNRDLAKDWPVDIVLPSRLSEETNLKEKSARDIAIYLLYGLSRQDPDTYLVPLLTAPLSPEIVAVIPLLIIEQVFVKTTVVLLGDMSKATNNPLFGRLSDDVYRDALKSKWYAKLNWVLRVALHNGKSDLICSYLSDPTHRDSITYYGTLLDEVMTKEDALMISVLVESAGFPSMLNHGASNGKAFMVSAIMQLPGFLNVSEADIRRFLKIATEEGHTNICALLEDAPQLTSPAVKRARLG